LRRRLREGVGKPTAAGRPLLASLEDLRVSCYSIRNRHGMIKRSNKFIRDARGMMVLAEPDAKKVVTYFLPNGGGL
jgi:large subunit ribosomal protein L35